MMRKQIRLPIPSRAETTITYSTTGTMEVEIPLESELTNEEIEMKKFIEIRKPRLLRLMKAIKNNAWKFHLEHSLFRIGAHSGLSLMDKTFPQSANLPFRWLACRTQFCDSKKFG